MDITNQLIDTIFTFSRSMKERMGVKSDVANLTMVQLQTLIFLARQNPSPMSKIAEFLQIELPSATSLVTNLVAMNLVERLADENDKRIVTIGLTKNGSLLLSKAKKTREEKIRSLLSHLSDTDKKHLLLILEKIVKADVYEK